MGEFNNQPANGFCVITFYYTLTAPVGFDTASLPHTVEFAFAEVFCDGVSMKKPESTDYMTVFIRRLPDGTSMIGKTTMLTVTREEARRLWDEYIKDGLVPVLDEDGKVLIKKQQSDLSLTNGNLENNYSTSYALTA
jgi:hypothetical protein